MSAGSTWRVTVGQKVAVGSSVAEGVRDGNISTVKTRVDVKVGDSCTVEIAVTVVAADGRVDRVIIVWIGGVKASVEVYVD